MGLENLNSLSDLLKETLESDKNTLLSDGAVKDYLNNIKEDFSKEIKKIQNKIDAKLGDANILKRKIEEKNAYPGLLEKKLENKEYLHNFTTAITLTSIYMYMVAALTAEQQDKLTAANENFLDKQLEDFLVLSSNDDNYMFDMKMYHLTGVTGEVIFGDINRNDCISEEDFDNKRLLIKKLRKEFDVKMKDIQSAYVSTIIP